MWFVDKLGPVSQAQAEQLSKNNKNKAPVRGAAPVQQARSQPAAAPAPEKPKKKGWF
jgi:hypothetical protein